MGMQSLFFHQTYFFVIVAKFHPWSYLELGPIQELGSLASQQESGLSVWSLHVLAVCVWVLSGNSEFLPVLTCMFG